MLRAPYRFTLPAVLLGLATMALAVGPSPVRAQECTISGPTVVCDEPVQLCAPEGDVSYEWTGPEGFTSDQRCITVSVPGAYTLRLFDFINGLWMGPCAVALEPGNCDPPPSMGGDCPRTAHFWFKQATRRDRGHRNLAPEVVARVAAGVDRRLKVFEWRGSTGPFAAVLAPACSHNPRSRALRQVAAVAANVSAGEVGVTSRSGSRVCLDPNTSIVWNGESTTIGAWLTSVDAELLSLDRRRSNKDAVRKAYHKIAGFARSLNRGEGIAVACGNEALSSDEQAEEDAID
jgi:hypothetical protein